MAQYLYKLYQPQSIDYHQAKVNSQYIIQILKVLITLFDLENRPMLYRIFFFILIEKSHLKISGCLKCEANLKSPWIATLLIKKKLIYVENRFRKKTLYHLEHSLYFNSSIFFTFIKILFNYLEDIFGNFY